MEGGGGQGTELIEITNFYVNFESLVPTYEINLFS